METVIPINHFFAPGVNMQFSQRITISHPINHIEISGVMQSGIRYPVIVQIDNFVSYIKKYCVLTSGVSHPISFNLRNTEYMKDRIINFSFWVKAASNVESTTAPQNMRVGINIVLRE